MKNEILEWQQDFRNQPRIWLTLSIPEGFPTDAYESKEAAELAIKWYRDRGEKRSLSLGSMKIHSMELSKRRWGG